jgi:hypothetical protein
MAGLHGCEPGELLEEFMVLLGWDWGEEEKFMHLVTFFLLLKGKIVVGLDMFRLCLLIC